MSKTSFTSGFSVLVGIIALVVYVSFVRTQQEYASDPQPGETVLFGKPGYTMPLCPTLEDLVAFDSRQGTYRATWVNKTSEVEVIERRYKPRASLIRIKTGQYPGAVGWVLTRQLVRTSNEPSNNPTTQTIEATTTSEGVKTGLVPVDIQLPRPMFVGTPTDTRVPNLEKPLGKPRPPFMAPAGTKNVALGKPISSSDEEPIIGEIEMITDGNMEAADGSYVELGPFVQHVTIDLGTQYDIYAILVWHYHKEARVYFDVVVHVGDDVDFITNVKTVFNNDIDNSAGLGVGKDMHYVETNEGKLIDVLAQGIKARSVRLYSNGNTSNDLNHYIEVAVYGKPIE